MSPERPSQGARNEPSARSVLDERLESLSRRIREWLEESHLKAGTLHEILEQARGEALAVDSMAGSHARVEPEAPIAGLAEFARNVESATSQAAVLDRLLEASASFSSRSMLFVLRQDSLVGWRARGFDDGLKPSALVLPAGGDSLMARARRAGSDLVEVHDAAMAPPIVVPTGQSPAREMMAAPLWVKGGVPAVLYAEDHATGVAWSPDALRVLVSLASLGLESLPARARHPRPRPAARTASAADAIRTVGGARIAFEPGAPQVEDASALPDAGLPPSAEPDPDVARRHEEARRFARLLVSEIVLYNEREIEEGRRSKDLYQRLKEDIERSREMYLGRIGPDLTDAAGYFREELVRALARGDESALNAPWD